MLNKAKQHRPFGAGPRCARPLLAALAGFRVLTVSVSSFVPALLAFGFLSGSAKSLSSPVCGFALNGDGGSVVLLGFAQLVFQVPVGSPYRS